MQYKDIKGCIDRIMQLTGCSRITADTIYKIVCVWNGGNFPDEWTLPNDWDIKGKL